MEQWEKIFKDAIPEDMIVLTKANDGNWEGIIRKFGNLVEVRDIGPETVLQRLLTSDGS